MSPTSPAPGSTTERPHKLASRKADSDDSSAPSTAACIITPSEVTFSTAWQAPSAHTHKRNRFSRILLGQYSALQFKPENSLSSKINNAGSSPGPPDSGKKDEHDHQRPFSYPQSQRWRKSSGVSVRAITRAFEKMRRPGEEPPMPPLPIVKT